jgi:hypothetical protein
MQLATQASVEACVIGGTFLMTTEQAVVISSAEPNLPTLTTCSILKDNSI